MNLVTVCVCVCVCVCVSGRVVLLRVVADNRFVHLFFYSVVFTHYKNVFKKKECITRNI